MVKKRKAPERKCVVTNETKPKKDLIRIVRNKEGEVFVDPTGKKNGRGAYLSRNLDVVLKAEKSNILNRTLNTEVNPAIFEELKQLIDGKPNEK
ncbi:YlxR family protein [Oceanobacillus profundus]|uniref:YlxR family protein n=1 Tax=Oceanobacillus profundus TaxID=372463 RepID=A0A417YKF5_9BACI|nr:YlxR family protein [Oceanobacillus profundus]MBR3121543.1 YlxR family protein [Oceanobacillus sp.]PAE30067.1 RNA-binding protein [Paenibacillus sp. 7884-2]MCM3396389.1 YlxR family protein [Oceanobacillus profundus]MDO6449601.1 YlxR family protein [Oceanobacillus profundus]RHW33606.1 YlxR family protein [Oceanobacillus profundus]